MTPTPAHRRLPALARRAIAAHIAGERIALDDEPRLPSAPVFVTLRMKKDHDLRGCVGRLLATSASLADEVAVAAVSAATQDPRFLPVLADELPDIDVEVSVLSPEEPVRSLTELDPKRFGVVVRAGARSGVLLPDIDGVDRADEQVAIARRKAGILPDEDAVLSRFTVLKLVEGDT